MYVAAGDRIHTIFSLNTTQHNITHTHTCLLTCFEIAHADTRHMCHTHTHIRDMHRKQKRDLGERETERVHSVIVSI